MSSFKVVFCLTIFVLCLIGCATTPTTPQKTQLEVRQFQTRDFDVKDSKMVMKSCLNVLQDDDYIVKNANADLGLLTATKEVDIEKKGEAFAALFFIGSRDARWKKNQIIECSLNIGESGNRTTVRANFQSKIMNNKGEVVKVVTIEDPTFYQTFFAKVDKGVFLGKNKL
jgi:hypothetical protein